MSTIAQLLVVVEGNSAGLTGAMTKASASVGTFGAGAQKTLGQALPLAATAGTIAVAAFAASSVKAAVDFEASFTRIDAISNATAADIAQWRDAAMSLGGETAQAPNDLADALFFLSSAGLDTAQINETLEMSAKAAAVGLGTTTDVANITASALNAYAKTGLTAAEVTDTLVAAVREGRAEPEEFATALGRILPVASQAGISFDQVAASLASLSNIGLDVNEGVTAMRGLLLALEAPGAKAQAALKELGMSADDVRASLAEDGLIATLRMLEQQTGGDIDAIAALVPNVRSLVGVFGLTGQKAKEVNAIFDNVANSAGSLDEAFKATSQGSAFQLSKAFNDIKIAGEKLAIAVLPTLVDIATGFSKLIGVVGTLSPLIAVLVSAFLAMKVLNFIPDLLLQIAINLERIGALSASGAVETAAYAAGLASFGTILAGVAVGLGAVYTAYKIFTGGDPTFVPELATALADTATQTDLLGTKFQDLATKQAYLAAGAHNYAREIGHLPPYVIDAGHAFDKLGQDADVAQERIANFAHMSNAELKKFRSDTISAFAQVAGSLESASNDWRMLSNAAVKATGIMAKQQKIIANDLEELDKLNVGDDLKAQLLALGPGMVDAFIQGNKNQRQDIRDNLKDYDKASTETTDAVQRILKTGMHEAGIQGTKGLAAGFFEGTPWVVAAATQMANKAVAAAKAVLKIESPSKVMEGVGVNFMLGFANGITKTLGTLTDAIHSAVTAGIDAAKTATKDGMDVLAATTMDQVSQLQHALRKAKMFEGLGSDLTAKLEELQGKIDDFSSSIQSGFDSVDLVGGALDLPQQLHDNLVASVQAELDAAQLAGESADVIASLEADLAAAQASSITATTADYTTYLQDQLAATQEFAAGLTQLSAMGLNTATLTDLASQGVDVQPLIDALLLSPDLIASFNQTQKAITDVTNSTIDTLVNDVFGTQLAKAGREADRLSERLAAFADDLQAQKWGNDVNDVLRALEKLQKQLDEFSTPGSGGDGGGGGGGGGTAQPGYAPPLDPTNGAGAQPVVFNQNVYGDVMTEGQLVDKFHEGLLKKQKRNATLGFH